jgi:multiple sugar transport system permease protein
MAVWFYYPLVNAIVMSFQDANIIRLNRAKFIGFQNYLELLRDPEFLSSLKNSMIMVVVVVPVLILISMILAVNINGIRKYKSFFRTLYYMPYITSTIAVTTIFMYLFVQDGIVTKLLTYLGFPNVTWHFDMQYTLPFMIILCIWTYIGFYVVAYLAGLQGIPEELYESSRMDGANFMHRFLYITVPMLTHTTTLVLVSSSIYVLQFFDQPFAMARGSSLGSPAGASSTAVVFVYNEAFKHYKLGYGSAAAVIIFAIILLISAAQKLVFEREEGV